MKFHTTANIEPHEKLLIDIHELSELTGFSVGTLYHFVSQKRIPVVRISSRCVRFRLSDIEKWIVGKLEDSQKIGKSRQQQ